MRGQDAHVYVGMRYWYPFMEDAVAQVRLLREEPAADCATQRLFDHMGLLSSCVCHTLGILRCVAGIDALEQRSKCCWACVAELAGLCALRCPGKATKAEVDAARAQIKADGVTDLVVLPLYPQFSISTSGSSLRLLQQMFEADAELDGLRHCVIASWCAAVCLAPRRTVYACDGSCSAAHQRALWAHMLWIGLGAQF